MVTPLDQDQVKQLLQAARGDNLECLYVLAIATGMRQGELLGLRWGDIDFDSGTLSVKRTLSDVAGYLSIGEPKTRKGRRRIDLPNSVVTMLAVQRQALDAERTSDESYIFCDTRGGPRCQSVVQTALAARGPALHSFS